MYSISAYGRMIADEVRVKAYAQALRQAIKPDSVVLEIGAGTGFFSLLACQFGARKVYAVEPDAALQMARELAVTNGYADRIEFIQELSTKTTLPERADILISDLRGTLPIFQRHIPSIVDARRRLLTLGGTLIPRADTVWVTVVEAQDLYLRQSGVAEDHPYGIDMRAARRMSLNSWRGGRAAPEQFLAEPQVWAKLDYSTIEEPDVSSMLHWEAKRAALAHGLNVWFEAEVAAGLSFSTGPDTPETIYGTAFFPFQEPVSVAIGDSIAVEMKADLINDDYIWRWETRVTSAGKPTEVKAEFKQSTFYAVPLSFSQLRKQADSYLPKLSEQGQIDQFILGYMTGEITQGELARLVMEQYPQHFASWKEALTHIGELTKRYSL
jgi:type I protein arginine methyltransferase